MDSYLQNSDIVAVKTQSLSRSATFSRLQLRSRIIDCYEGRDVGRATIDALIEKFKTEVTDWPENEPYFSLWDQMQMKSVVLMTPYMKARYAEGYAIAKSPLIVAVLVNQDFLEDDSRAYLRRQMFDIKDTTAFFTSFETGLRWLKNWGTVPDSSI